MTDGAPPEHGSDWKADNSHHLTVNWMIASALQNSHVRTLVRSGLMPGGANSSPHSGTGCSLRSGTHASMERTPTPSNCVLSGGHQPGFHECFNLVEGLFVVSGSDSAGEGGGLTTLESWPRSLSGSRLENLLIKQNFCPSPASFHAPHSADGFGGQPAVLTLLQTALDEHADPGGELYACIDGDGPGGAAAGAQPRIFCLVSKVPLFAFHIRLLRLLRGGCDREALIGRLGATALSRRVAQEGVNIADMYLGVSNLQLTLPRGLAGLPNEASVSREFPVWQASWGLEGLLARWPDFVGEPLLRLVALALLEQKVILLGDAPRLSRVALAIKGLLMPFKWLHLFLSSPLPISGVPIEDVPVPMLVALTRLPSRIPSAQDLPPGIVAVDLGGPSASTIPPGKLWMNAATKMPGGHERQCLKELKAMRARLQKGEILPAEASQVALTSVSRLVGSCADVVSNYARDRATAVTRLDADECFRDSSECDVFIEWLNPSRSDRTFYESFFRTQLCLEFLFSEIEVAIQHRISRTGSRPHAEQVSYKPRPSLPLRSTAEAKARHWRCTRCWYEDQD